MKTMKKTIAHIILFLSALPWLAACTDRSLPASPAPESGRVVIAYTIAGAQTRATAAGWNEGWNENLVSSLYLLVMRGREVKVHGPYNENHIDPQNGTYETLETDLDVADIARCDSVYLVANCPSVANIKTVQQLQQAIISLTGGDPTLTYNGKQTLFAMDAIGRIATDADNNMTLTFDLVRAAAKIRLTILPQGPDGIDVLKSVTYRACNFATSTHLLAAMETYDNLSSWTNDETFIPVNKDQVYQADTDSPQGIVFYSYPNDWFNTSRITKDGDNYVIEDMHTSPPILYERQTYILICAPYNGVEGYYKIPVNHQLPDDSDQTSFTENEYKNEIRPLYRLERNHFYDISVTIDLPGGPIEDPVIPDFSIRIKDWTEGGDYTLSPDDFV